MEPKGGRHFTSPTPDRSAFAFDCFLCDLALQYPAAKTIHLVMDNLNAHRRKSLVDAFGKEMGGEIWERFAIHYTPKHGSWLNQAEIEISLFARQCLGKRRIPDLKTLRRETRTWNSTWCWQGRWAGSMRTLWPPRTMAPAIVDA